MKSLRHFLQNELYNLFHSKSFLFVLLILLIIVTADDILAYKSYKDNLQLIIWIPSETILCVILYNACR